MKLLCLNAWGGTLHAALLPYLRMAAPDILCLQEVVHTPASTQDWLTYRDGDHILPQRANLFRDVAAALPDHTAIFCPAAQGVLWDGDAAVPSQWGIATFVRNTLPIVGQLQDFVHKDFSADGYGDHPRSRVAHVVRIHDGERAVCIAQMHGLRDLAGKGDTPERRAQAERLKDMITCLARPEEALVVCGDFNVESGSETLAVLAAMGLTELVTGRGFAGTRTSHYKKPGRFADYMLVNRHVEVRSFDVITDPEVSDHCPLELVF